MKINLKKLMILANLDIPKSQQQGLENQLQQTLMHVERLTEIKTSEVSETNEVTGLKNIMREDCITGSLSQHEALMNAKFIYNGFFKVDAVLIDEKKS